MTRTSDRQIQAARDIAAHLASRLEADLCLQLWNGEIVPLGPQARDDIRIAINSPAAIRSLLLKPKFVTIYELFASGELSIEGGTPMQAARRWDHMKALHLRKTVNKTYLASRLWPFLLGARSMPLTGSLDGARPSARKRALRATTSR